MLRVVWILLKFVFLLWGQYAWGRVLSIFCLDLFRVLWPLIFHLVIIIIILIELHRLFFLSLQFWQFQISIQTWASDCWRLMVTRYWNCACVFLFDCIKIAIEVIRFYSRMSNLLLGMTGCFRLLFKSHAIIILCLLSKTRFKTWYRFLFWGFFETK